MLRVYTEGDGGVILDHATIREMGGNGRSYAGQLELCHSYARTMLAQFAGYAVAVKIMDPECGLPIITYAPDGTVVK